MKLKLFISYSDLDKDKVDIIVNELKEHSLFEPVVIASNREALKPLVKKVSEGIVGSAVVIPILTRKSISTQWINQEIGFSFGIEKKVKPIVDANIIHEFKGFIHKQVDLPYSYSTDTNEEIENSHFLSSFKLLINDLEKEFADANVTPMPQRSPLEERLIQIYNYQEEVEFNRAKEAFLNSPEAAFAARDEVDKLFTGIQETFRILGANNFHFAHQSAPHYYSIFSAGGYSCSFFWLPKFNNKPLIAKLEVKYWKGVYKIDDNGLDISTSNPRNVDSENYSFDRDTQLRYCWLAGSHSKNFSTSEIVENAFIWIIDMITKGRPGN